MTLDLPAFRDSSSCGGTDSRQRLGPTDGEKVEAFIRERGIRSLPAGHAGGAARTKATARGLGAVESFPFRPDNRFASPEARLARAKLLTLFEDLSGKGRCEPRRRLKVRNDAYLWFFERSDFEAWCDMAGFRPEVVRERARMVRADGKTWAEWRAAPGKGERFAERKRFRERTGR